MSRNATHQILETAQTGPGQEAARRRRRLALATLTLLYVLVVAFLFLFNPPPTAMLLALVPILLAAALYDIPGGLAGALLGAAIVSARVTLDVGWPWPGELQIAIPVVLGGFFGLGGLAGWISKRENRRDELLRAALRETDDQRRQFLAVLENAPVPVLITDGGGFLSMANASALDALGLQPPVALGQDIASIAPDRALADLFYQTTLSGKPVGGEVKGAQDRTLSASISPVPGVGSVAVLQDITHLKALNERKNEMISAVSHDLKNPLTAIQGYADLVSKMGALNEKQQTFIKRVKASANRMIALINDLLDVAWIEAGMEIRRERTDLSAIARAAVGDYRAEAAAKSLELKADLSDADTQVMGDGLRLRQMIDNLVGNAIKYSDEGGKITVSLRCENDKVVCRVRDTGMGIAEEHLDKVFDRYFRVDEASEQTSGSGLGLAIVKAIVDQHGGSIRVESVVGEGSTFTVELPSAA